MWQLIAGPILGLVGSAVEKYHEVKLEQLKIQERALDRAHELAVMSKESELALQQTTVQGEIAQDIEAARAFTASYNFANDTLIPEGAKLGRKQLNWVVAVEILSKAIRPLATIWYQLLIAAVFGWAAYKLASVGGEVFAGEEIAGIFREVVYSVIGMGETTLFWWFGIRRMSKKKVDG